MRFVLDTNMVSLAMRGDSRVIDHLKAFQGDDLLISAVTLAEIEYGLARLPRSARGPSKRASELRELFDALLTYMGIAAWDRGAALRYASMRSESENAGLTIDHADMMIASHALSLDATLVTADRTLLRRPKPRWMPATANWAGADV